MSSTEITLNEVALTAAVPEAYVLSVTRPLVGRRRHEAVDVPGRAGSIIFTEQPGDRILVVEIDLQADSFADRRAAVRRLADWADLGVVARLEIDDEPDRYHDALLDDSADPNEWLVGGHLELPFRVGPYALAIATTSEEITGTSGNGGDTVNLPDDVSAEVVIEVDPDGTGYIDTFQITVNGDTLSVIETFDVDQVFTISSISDTVTAGTNTDTMLTGAFDPDQVRMQRVSGRFPMLVPGANVVTFSWDGSASTVIVRLFWRRRFR